MKEISPNWDEIFHDRGIGAPWGNQPCKVLYENGSRISCGVELEAIINDLRLGECVVVIHSVAELGAIRRLVTLLARESMIAGLESFFVDHGLTHVRSYGVYPNLEKIGLVYERHSAAALYAEANLLTGSTGRLRKLLQVLLDKVVGGASQVDVIAVVGQKT